MQRVSPWARVEDPHPSALHQILPNPAGRCRQRPIPEPELESQFARQLAELEFTPEALEGLRQALQESFQHEQEYRRAQLAALRRRQDEIEKKRDVLTERYLEDRIPEEEYQRKYGAYRRELFEIGAEIERLADTHELYIEEIELLLKLGSQLAGIYANSGPERRRGVVNLVALNATLKAKKARLNLHPAFAVLTKAGTCPEWWGLNQRR